jgi:hypothetical protein
VPVLQGRFEVAPLRVDPLGPPEPELPPHRLKPGVDCCP